MAEQSYRSQLAVVLEHIRNIESMRGMAEGSLQSLLLTGLEVHDEMLVPVSHPEMMEREWPVVNAELGQVAGGECLFYRGGFNLVYGPPGAGKTMLMQAIARDEVRSGRRVLWLEMEEGDWPGVQTRWKALTPDEQLDGLWFQLLPKMPTPLRDKLVEFVGENNIDMVIIDSFGELLGKFGKNENDDNDVQWAYDYLAPFAQAGCAVVIIDHPPKSDRKTASGSKRKLARPWVAYAMNVDADDEEDTARAFSRRKAGFSRLTCIKDRFGTYARGQIVCRMDVIPTQDTLIVEVAVDIDDIDSMLEPPARKAPLLSVDSQLDMLVSEAAITPLTSQYVKNLLHLETKKAAEEILALGRERGLWMWNKGRGGYVNVSRL